MAALAKDSEHKGHTDDPRVQAEGPEECVADLLRTAGILPWTLPR